MDEASEAIVVTAATKPPNSQFEARVQKLAQEILMGKMYLTLANGIATADPVVLDVAPTFWGVTVHGCFVLALLHAARLFDTGKNTLSIPLLLKTAKNQTKAFKDPARLAMAIQDIELRMWPKLETTLASIKKLRNKTLAHNDLRALSDIQNFERGINLTKSDVSLVFEMAGRALNSMSVAYNGAEYGLEIIDDYTNALELIADAKCAQADEFESRFGIKADFDRPAKCSKYIALNP